VNLWRIVVLKKELYRNKWQILKFLDYNYSDTGNQIDSFALQKLAKNLVLLIEILIASSETVARDEN